MRELEHRVAVVTGAASGIGLALATKLAHEGMRVVLSDVDGDRLDAAAQTLEASGFEAAAQRTDVAHLDEVHELAAFAVERYGGVHVLCNNAGVDGFRGGSLWEATSADWSWTMGVNFWGVVHGIRAFVPLMLDSGQPGHIVNTASAAALLPANNMYGVTKHGVLALSEALSAQLHHAGASIGVSALLPGFVATELFSRRRRPADLDENPDDIARGQAERDRNNALVHGIGATPDQIADRVVRDGIRGGKLYVLTHESAHTYIRTRADAMIDEFADLLPTEVR